MVELVQIESRTTEINECADSVFLCFSLSVVVVMVASACAFFSMFMMVLMPMVLMSMLMVVMFMMMMCVFFILIVMSMVMVILLQFVKRLFYFLDPCCRSGNIIKIKKIGVYEACDINIGIITFNNLCFRLKSANDCLDAFTFVFAYFRYLIQKDYVTELNLLYDKVFDILFIDILFV